MNTTWLLESISSQRESLMQSGPPNDLPHYRVLTGRDDAAFCWRVSEALGIGFELYGSPSLTFNGEHVIVAQAVVWPDEASASNVKSGQG